MSDKKFQMLSPLDQELRRSFPVGMLEGVQVRIEKVVGFELFNTRAYHNHETWSDGYRIVGPVEGAWSPYANLKAALAGLVADVVGTTMDALEQYGVEPPASAADEIVAKFDDPNRLRKVFNAASGSMSALLSVSAEDLDDAVALFLDHREKVREILAAGEPETKEAEARSRTALAVLGYHYDPEATTERTAS